MIPPFREYQGEGNPNRAKIVLALPPGKSGGFFNENYLDTA